MSRGERRILWKSARLGSIHCQCCRPDQIPQGFYQEMMTKSLILVVWYHPQHKPQTLLVKIWHLRSLAVLSGSHAFKAHQEILPSWGKISHRMGIAFAYLSQQKLEISPSEPNWNNWSAWKQTCVSPSTHTRNREKLAKKNIAHPQDACHDYWNFSSTWTLNTVVISLLAAMRNVRGPSPYIFLKIETQ